MPSAVEVEIDRELYPAPFPTEVPTIPLARLSVQKLLAGDADEAATLFDVCCNEGFFYLDLTTDARGRQFLAEAQQLHHVARDVFRDVPVLEKQQFAPSDATGHLETGYKCMSFDEHGQPDLTEFLNISHHGLLCTPDAYVLPAWLAPHAPLYRSFMRSGSVVANLVLAILEQQLHLQAGELTALHQTEDASGDFLRMLHYPAPRDASKQLSPTSPAHTDAVSVTMLFNWQGGLQITKPAQPLHRNGRIEVEDCDWADDEWRYVRPEPGCAIVNLGDTMVVLSNGLLKSGRHRVVVPPGPQGRFDRYSILTNARPANNTLMRPLVSDRIPPLTPAQRDEEVLTALQWSMKKVRAILKRMSRPAPPPLPPTPAPAAPAATETPMIAV